MEHRYRRAILNDIERLDRDKAFAGENGIWDSGEKLKELNEVYRKAHNSDRVIDLLKEQVKLMESEYEDFQWKKLLLKKDVYAEILKELEGE